MCTLVALVGAGCTVPNPAFLAVDEGDASDVRSTVVEPSNGRDASTDMEPARPNDGPGADGVEADVPVYPEPDAGATDRPADAAAVDQVAPPIDAPPALNPDTAPDLAPDIAPDMPVAMLGTPVGRWSLDSNVGNGTLHGGATVVTGAGQGAPYSAGGSLSLNGTTGYAQLATAGLPAFNQRMTVSFWYQVGGPLGERKYLVVFEGTGTGMLEFLIDGGSPLVWLGHAGGGRDYYLPERVKSGWNQIAYTYDPAVGNRIYVDGVLSARAVPMPPGGGSVNALILGTMSPGGGGRENFVGRIDDLRIYNRALSAAEIAALYAGAP